MSWDYNYWYINNFYSKKERKSITSFIEKNYKKIEDKEKAATDDNGNIIKNTNTLEISWKKIKNLTKDLEANINLINEQNFGYVLFPFSDLKDILLNIYDSKNKSAYGWHYDTSRSNLQDCKLTVLINLSENYEGGELYFFQGYEHQVKEFTPGTVLLFKSHLYHKVMPVIKGVRKTLTLFCNGPKFR